MACEGASAGVIRIINRLTTNKVSDTNAYIDRGTIYWDRFGGEQGDTEVFSFHISSDTTTRLTRNKFDDTLQSAGVWISSPTSLRPTTQPLSFSGLDSLGLAAVRHRNRDSRRREVYTRYYQATQNKRFEASVQVADNFSHGTVWLSKKIPTGRASLFSGDGYDVTWFNGRNRRATRLPDAPNATSVAFGGPWVARTTTSRDEVMYRHIRSDVTRTIAVDQPGNLNVVGSYIKYETPGSVNLEGPSFVVLSDLQSRIKIYDALTDTLIDVGDDPLLGYHNDRKSVMSDQYVAYDRSFRNPLVVTASINPLPEVTELRLFDIVNLTDILITEGSGISGIVMDDDTLVWQMLDKSAPDPEDWDLEIFAYSFRSGTVRQVTDNKVDDFSPQVSGDTILWTTNLPKGGTEIFYETTDYYPESPLFPPGGGIIMMDGLQGFSTPFPPAGVVEAVVPEPAGAVLMSIAGLAAINRRRE